MLRQWIGRWTGSATLGLDLGSALVKAVEVAQDGQRVLLRRCALATVEHDHPAVALRRLLKQLNVRPTDVAVGLASPEVIVRPFAFPRMSRRELESAVRLEAEQAILNGHAPQDMTIDWHLFPAAPNESYRGLLAVVPKPVVNARLAVARTAGLVPSIIDVEGLALWNAYWTLAGRRGSPKTVLLINIGARTTNLVVARGLDQLMLVRDIQAGTLALGKGEEREWLSEIRDSLSYARSSGGLRTLDTGYVTGGGATPDTARLVGSVASVSVECWNPLEYIVRDAASPAVESAAGPLLAVALGLALRRPS